MWNIARLNKLRVELEDAVAYMERDGNHRPSDINTYFSNKGGSGYRSRFYVGHMFEVSVNGLLHGERQISSSIFT
jgi:hypothetical protein